MSLRWSLPLVGLVLSLLAGCAARPQLGVDLAPATIATGATAKVGVAVAKVPKSSLETPGANCLLCLIAAQAGNTSVARHFDTLGADELLPVRDQIADAMRKKGMNVVAIQEPVDLATLKGFSSSGPNTAKLDFAPLKAKYGVDKIVLVAIDAYGLQRNYSAYIPTGNPRAFLRATGYMVNLSNNVYEWYRPVTLFKAAEGAWDEPPKYPGLTNAFYQTLELGKDQLLEPWVR